MMPRAPHRSRGMGYAPPRPPGENGCDECDSVYVADYEPSDEALAALHELLGSWGLLEAGRGRGGIAPIIRKFGSWAGGRHRTCVAKLRGKAGIKDPVRLCAWLKDRAVGTTHWRGKGKRK